MRKEKQLSLFGQAEEETLLPPDIKVQGEMLPRSNPADWHRIHEIKPDGTFEWVASYSSKFSVVYAMQLFFCARMGRDPFCIDDLQRGKEALAFGKTGRTVILEIGGHTYTLVSKKGKSVLEGISGSKYDYKRFKLS